MKTRTHLDDGELKMVATLTNEFNSVKEAEVKSVEDEKQMLLIETPRWAEKKTVVMQTVRPRYTKTVACLPNTRHYLSERQLVDREENWLFRMLV